MNTLAARGAFLAGLFVATTAWAAAGPQTPQAFMERLYVEQETGPNAAKAPDWSRGGAGGIFDPTLAHLIRKYTAAADKDQSEGLGYVPFCGCNDDSGLHYKVTAAAPAAGRAKASVAITSDYAKGKAPDVLTYDLVLTSAGWRVADIHSKTEPSLKARMIENLRDEYHLRP